MIMMGMAKAYDFKIMLGTTTVLALALAAATRFGGSATPSRG